MFKTQTQMPVVKMKNKLKKTDKDKKSKNILAELFADDPEFLKMH